MLKRTAILSVFAMVSTTALADTSPPYTERYRPQFHFTSSTDWINDPNGLVFFEGEWHLFFQRVPGSNDGNTMTKSWGHAVSTDLVRWTQLPDALSPDDKGSIWSGSAVVDWQNTSGFGTGGKPPLVAFYTNAKDPFDQRLAYSNDRGRTWTKVAEPILKNVQGRNRDPKVIWYEPTKRWVMALYLDQRHRFALYDSANLRDWSLLHEVTLEGDDECPDFFPLPLDGDASRQKWIFTGANGRYLVGAFDGKTFTPETDSLPGDKGTGTFYAAQTFSDAPDGRRIQIAWFRDGKYPGMPFNQQLGFPCELTLRSTPRGPRLFKAPVREIESLRGEDLTARNVSLPAGRPVPIASPLNGCTEIVADVALGEASAVTLDVRGTPVTFRREGERGLSVSAWDRRVSLAPRDDGRVRFRALIDRTSIELFLEEGATVLSGCFLPADDRRNVSLAAEGGPAWATSLTAHQLNAAWPTTNPTTQQTR